MLDTAALPTLSRTERVRVVDEWLAGLLAEALAGTPRPDRRRGGPLPDHHGRRIGVARRHLRHDRRVGHAQPLDPVHLQRRRIDDGVLAAARKVIAVHINYPSRAAQRGRTPEQPSYFLKPSSSLALSGSGVERPAGCELLGFEGEIALIIGAPARRVSPETAWGHVCWITAANDLGVYDLRYADKGSNLRSKGGDGFTPVGPGLLPADAVDPADLALAINVLHRMMVNLGENGDAI